MRTSLLAVPLLLLSACADETATTLFGGGGGVLDHTSSSSGPTTSGVEPVPTSGEVLTTGSDASTEPGTDTGELENTSIGVTVGDGSTGTTSTSSSTGETSSTGDTSSTGEPAPSCDDGLVNLSETDVDCGGGLCGPCGLTHACTVDGDCGSGWCDEMQCAQPDCLVDADCDALENACVAASCDGVGKKCEVVAVNEGQGCDDGDLCSAGESCGGGVCGGGVFKDCSALDNFCGVGVCESQSGLCGTDSAPGMEGVACDDGYVCTPNDVCTDGVCGVGGPGFLFFEDFSAIADGWQLGPTWEVGPAVTSVDGYNGADPGDDHSASGDGLLVGTVIGGMVPMGALAKTCLTSPVIDASGPGAVILSFWRHLHTDGYPFASHAVEVFDGGMWQTVEVGYGGGGVDDADWTLMEYDLGAHKNALLRVRICHAQQGSAFVSAGWSIDDLTVGPFVCTPEI